MKDWGTYRKLFERLSPDFERLPFASRCFGAEILRRGDRAGLIIPGTELNEKLVNDLAFHVRAHTGEEDFLRRSLEVLISDGYLVIAGGYLRVRNFVEAQRSEAAARMADKRARDAAVSMDDTAEEALDDMPNVPPPDDRSYARDEHPECEPRDVTSRAHASSRLVSSRLSPDSDQALDKTNVTGKQVRARGAAENKPVPMTHDWLPPDDYVLIQAQKWEVDPKRVSAEIPEFRWYWVEGKGRGKKASPRGWLQTFGNRMAKLAEKGELYIERKAGRLLNGAPRAADQLERQLERIASMGRTPPPKALP